MKFIEYYKDFEKDFNTQIMHVKEGLQWKYKDNTKIITSKALGIYKRNNVDMYKVLRIISVDKRFNGSERSAIKTVKMFKKEKSKLGSEKNDK